MSYEIDNKLTFKKINSLVKIKREKLNQHLVSIKINLNLYLKTFLESLYSKIILQSQTLNRTV